MNMGTNNLQQSTWKGLCVCVLVRIRRCPGGPLFSVGPSNPFKSALLIPLSSHSCRGVMPAHTSILLSAAQRPLPAFFRPLQKSADIFFFFFLLKCACLLSSKDRVRLEDQYRFPLCAWRCGSVHCGEWSRSLLFPCNAAPSSLSIMWGHLLSLWLPPVPAPSPDSAVLYCTVGLLLM